MNRFFAACALALAFPGLASAGADQIDLKIGSVTIDPASMSTPSCVQVPILINDAFQNNRDLRDITFTVEITGDTGIINGGISANIIVANGFAPTGAGTGVTGLTNPGTDLANANGAGSPSCASIFNQATQGSGPALNFPSNINTFANWNINNNQGGVGRKQGFLIDLVANASIGNVAQNTDTLLAVLEIPIIANPGTAQLLINAVPDAVVAGANSYTWDDGTSIERVQIVENFNLSQASGAVNVFGVPNCSGATTSPMNPNWLDPQAGGLGATLGFTFPGTATIDRINLTSSDGLNLTFPSVGATTILNIDTTNDGSPSAGANRSYSASYEVEFPPGSGTFVGGATCNLTPDFAPGMATVAFSSPPIPGQPTSVDVTLTNVVWDGSKFGVLSVPGSTVDLVAPSSVAGNVLTFNGAYSIASVSPADVGTYSATGGAPDGTSFMASTMLGFTPPVNQTSCAAISSANIEGSVTVPLQGTDVVDWDVIYNGTTTNLPGGNGNFAVNNIVGNATSITISANGFDAMGNPVSDQIVCDIDYNPPTGVCTQDPDSTVTPVDFGTVITLSLASTNGVAATVDGVPMSPVVNPNTNFSVDWQATHVAVGDTVLNGVATNPDGETVSCTWAIDVIEPTITVTPTMGLVTTEAGGTDSFTISIDVAPSADVSIGISSSDPTEGTADTTMVVFTPQNWQTPKTVTVTGVDDPSVDGDIAYTIVTAAAMSSDSNYDGLESADVSVSNQDDDTASLSINDVSVVEGTGANTTATFTVTLDAPVDGGVSVAFISMDGSAMAPGDYSTVAGTLDFLGNAGEAQTFAVSVVGDADFETDETFSVVLSMVSNPRVTLSRSTGIGTIVNDDGADMAIVLTAVPQAGSVGDFHVINAVAINNGTGEATDVEIELSVPQGLTIISSSPSAGGTCVTAPPAGGLVLLTCQYPGATAVGANRLVEVLVQASAAGGSTVTAMTRSSLNDPVPENNSASAVVGTVAQQIPAAGWAALLALMALVMGVGLIRLRD